jgi:hypothetical protein
LTISAVNTGFGMKSKFSGPFAGRNGRIVLAIAAVALAGAFFVLRGGSPKSASQPSRQRRVAPP